MTALPLHMKTSKFTADESPQRMSVGLARISARLVRLRAAAITFQTALAWDVQDFRPLKFRRRSARPTLIESTIRPIR